VPPPLFVLRLVALTAGNITSQPRLPITITLLIAIADTSIACFAPASAKRQEGRAQISRCAKRSAARA